MRHNINDQADMLIVDVLRLGPESDDESKGGLTRKDLFKLRAKLYGIEKG